MSYPTSSTSHASLSYRSKWGALCNGPTGDSRAERVDVGNVAVAASGDDGGTGSIRGKFGGVVMAIKQVSAAAHGIGSRRDGWLRQSIGGVVLECSRGIFP